MAKTNTMDYLGVFRFVVCSKELDLMVVTLPEFKLCGIDWTVKMCKKSTINSDDDDDSKNFLSVYLISDFERNKFTDESSAVKCVCNASASIKLFHKNPQCESVVKQLSEQTFDIENSSHGIDEFIEWTGFLEHHVQNDVAKFEIEIKAGPLMMKKIKPYDLKKVSAEFKVEIESVSKLTSMFSSEVVVQGVRWKIQCKKENDGLAVYLYGEKSDMDAYWLYRVHLGLTLRSYNKIGKDIKNNFSAEFDRANFALGLEKYMKWSDFIDETKGYTRDDKAILSVALKVEDPVPMW